ncbi:MAG: lysophospholipid acyltransferase family protein [Oscillospiraceae bacterium]|nr:lysophospholipid acyltransferase family protein [Clostridiaceae bacterium]MDY5948217.1 lysophospholipid acyltransferase family protein [Oscillospiraceae bacterium]
MKKPEDREFGYKFLTPFMRVAFKFYYSPRIIGAEKIPKDSAIVIAGNHKHVYDQCLTIMATKRVIHYMAKKEYFEGKLAPLFRFVGCIPVDRSKRDFSSAMSALKVLKKGGAIGIFPEGTRNKTDKFLLNFKTGAVAMAKKTGAYIVPFGLTGDYKFRSKNLTIRYGEPFKADNMSVEEANEKLFREVERLMLENLNENKENLMNA